ncbi:hypothetical protein [uncultured Tolumonas sp.]|uniref:hypothetical protein n=1 Tax=uncultured Tolumonas sp. TaxID=263765 RepID=UPI002931645B|nr:hypothetical protein [uncultured Tolumonas sp.]
MFYELENAVNKRADVDVFLSVCHELRNDGVIKNDLLAALDELIKSLDDDKYSQKLKDVYLILAA